MAARKIMAFAALAFAALSAGGLNASAQTAPPAQAESADNSLIITKAFGDSQKPSAPKDPCDKLLAEKRDKVSFDFEKGNLREILNQMAGIGGINLVMAQDIEGSVTVRFQDIPWNEALDMILTNNSLGRECFGNILRVATLASLTAEQTQAGANVVDESCDQVLVGGVGKISVDFENADLRNLLRFIAEAGNLNMLISSEVAGSVSLALKEVPWNLALFSLLKNYGLAQECFGNVIRIATRTGMAAQQSARAQAEQARAQMASSRRPGEDQRFEAELRKLKSIPLELYENIRKNDPSLLADLEHYAGLFREKTELEQLKPQDFLKVIQFYKQLIDRAIESSALLLKTDLQTDFAQLRLVGVIRGDTESVALIETGDRRGHTVRLNTYLGPSFGRVASIEPQKVTVKETYRDYLGNQISNTRELELEEEGTQPPGNET